MIYIESIQIEVSSSINFYACVQFDHLSLLLVLFYIMSAVGKVHKRGHLLGARRNKR